MGYKSMDGWEFSGEKRLKPMECFRIPTWIRPELKDLISRSIPLVFALILQLAFNMTVTIFVGRLGEVQLAGTGLALTVLSFTQNGMAQGMSTACDTLFSQAYGANRKKLIGLYLQRSLVHALIFTLLVWSFFLVVEPGAVAIGIEPAIAKITGEYLLLYTPGILGNVIFQILTKYLLSQYIIKEVTIITIFGNIVNIGAHLLFVTYLEMGSRGSAIALSLASVTLTMTVILYIITTRLYTDTWPGWSAEAFYDWDLLARYAIPGMAMLSLEYIGYELGAVMAGILGPVYLSSVTVYSQIGPFLFTVYHAFGTNCCFRVGAKLGADDVIGAVRCTKVTYGIVFVLSVVAMILLTLLKHELPKIFTDDPDVIDMVADMVQVHVYYSIAIAITTQQCGVLRGCGRQVAGASIHLVGYIVCCVPIGACLMFLTDLKAVGFFVGIGVGLWVEFIILFGLLWFTDWNRQAAKARTLVDGSQQPSESRISLLHGGSRLGLPYKSGETLDVPAETEKTNDVSMEYGAIIKPRQKTIPRRRCTTAIVVKRSATFALVLSIFFVAVAQRLWRAMEVENANATTIVMPTACLDSVEE